MNDKFFAQLEMLHKANHRQIRDIRLALKKRRLVLSANNDENKTKRKQWSWFPRRDDSFNMSEGEE